MLLPQTRLRADWSRHFLNSTSRLTRSLLIHHGSRTEQGAYKHPHEDHL
jgi:hypothetical protein